MNELYERGFRKIAKVEDLPSGAPKLFRTGGSFVLLVGGSDEIRAADATGCIEAAGETSDERRLDVVAECLGGAQALAVDWNELVSKRPLPAVVHEGDVWVCVELCAGS